jgi:predicted O-methyltransferase YrrM
MNLETKYKEELSQVKKYISNDYIYKMFLEYGFHVGNTFIPLDSNINVYEGCFISLVFQAYLAKFRPKQFNVGEIGLAYGTSSMIILNEIIKSKLESNYTVFDPNQTQQWKSIGHNNILSFKRQYDTQNKVNYKLIEGFSNVAVPKIDGDYNIFFIDGSHATNIVMEDMVNADRLLMNQGIMILDDVRHTEVELAIKWFIKNYPYYKRVSIDVSKYPQLKFFKHSEVYYDKYDKTTKKRYNNPSTMFALLKDDNFTLSESIIQNTVSLHLQNEIVQNKDAFIKTAMKHLSNQDIELFTSFYEKNRKLECIGDTNAFTRIVLCVNKMIKIIADMEKLYLSYDFKDIGFDINEGGNMKELYRTVYSNLSLFCLHAFVIINFLININIYVTDFGDDSVKYRNLKLLMTHKVMKDIIPTLYGYVKIIMDIVINNKEYYYGDMFIFSNKITNEPTLNKTKEFMKNRKEGMKLTWDTSKFEKLLNKPKPKVSQRRHINNGNSQTRKKTKPKPLPRVSRRKSVVNR